MRLKSSPWELGSGGEAVLKKKKFPVFVGGLWTQKPILELLPAQTYNVHLRLRVDGHTRARGLRGRGVCLLRRQPAIGIHEARGSLVYDEACEQGPKEQRARSRRAAGPHGRKKKEEDGSQAV